jgi:hypothetical protein
VVRQLTLDQPIRGSNPLSPAILRSPIVNSRRAVWGLDPPLYALPQRSVSRLDNLPARRLFLDELCEFSRQQLKALRQPLEERSVTVVRVPAAVTYPADFALVAAANPCPCGHHGDARGCSCDPRQLNAYRGSLSGPI